MTMDNVPEINPNRQYRPSEICKNGWIVNNKNKPNYKYILRLISAKKLKARDGSFADSVKYYQVMGRDIIEYRKENYGLDTPIQESHRPEQNILPQS